MEEGSKGFTSESFKENDKKLSSVEPPRREQLILCGWRWQTQQFKLCFTVRGEILDNNHVPKWIRHTHQARIASRRMLTFLQSVLVKQEEANGSSEVQPVRFMSGLRTNMNISEG